MTKMDPGDRSFSGRPGPAVPCPECGEAVPAAAVKCRYCGGATVIGADRDRELNKSGGHKTDTASGAAWDNAFASISRRREPGTAYEDRSPRVVGAIMTGAGVLALLAVGLYLMFPDDDGGWLQVPKVVEGPRIADRHTNGDARPAAEEGQSSNGAATVEDSAAASGDVRDTPQADVKAGPPPAENSTGKPSVSGSVQSGPEGKSDPGGERGAAAGRGVPDMDPFPDIKEPGISVESVPGIAPELPTGESTAAKNTARQDPAPERDVAVQTPPPPVLLPPPAAPAAVPPPRVVVPHKAVAPVPSPTANSGKQAARSRRPKTADPSRPKANGGRGQITAIGDLVAWVQLELSRRGLYRGPVDGRAGNNTREAIKSYQRQQQMMPTGKIDATLTTALRRTAASPKSPPRN